MKRQTSANCWFTIFCPTVIFKIQADRACWQWQAGVHQGDEGAIPGSGVRRPDDLCRRVSCGLAAGAATRPLRPNLQLSAFHCSVDVPLHQPLGVGVGGSRALDASAESSVSLRQHTRFARSPLSTPPDLPPGSRRSHLVRTSLAPPVLPGSSSRPPVHSSRCVQRARLQRRLSLPHFNPSQPPTTPAWVTTTFL